METVVSAADFSEQVSAVEVSRLHFGGSTMTMWPPISWADACVLIDAYAAAKQVPATSTSEVQP